MTAQRGDFDTQKAVFNEIFSSLTPSKAPEVTMYGDRETIIAIGDDGGNKVIAIYYKSGSIKFSLFWLTSVMLLWVGTMAIFMPIMVLIDERTKNDPEIYGYAIVIAICAWILAFIIFL